jgi:Cu/Ag efflux protein CusF
MMKAATLGAALMLGIAAMQPAVAQTPLASAAQAVVASAQPVHVKAQIAGIDRAARVVTLRGPAGNEVDIAIGPQVGNFDQLNVGDTVDVLYKNALLVAADKVTGNDKGIRQRVDTSVYIPASSGYDAARQVEVVATVQRIDRKKHQVTLRGVYRTVTLDVPPNLDLKDVKVGDSIHAVFVSAYATQVTPAGAAQ